MTSFKNTAATNNVQAFDEIYKKTYSYTYAHYLLHLTYRNRGKAMIATSDPEVFSGALLSEATFSRTDCVVFAEAPSNNPALANALTKLGYQRWASDCWTGNFKAPETDLYACILPE